MTRSLLAVALLVPGIASGQDAAKPRFPEGKSGDGRLKYVDTVPVLVVKGTPEEMGKQFGELALAPSKKPLLTRVDSYVEQIGWKETFPKMLKRAPLAALVFPKDHWAELTAAVKAADVDQNLLTALNVIPDFAKLGGCSTVIAQPERSSTGKPIFGRNLDWPPFEELPEYTLIHVVKPKGKKAVAMVGLPVLIGCLSGMNEDGLCLTINEITASKDKAPVPNEFGTPMLMLFRKILEECSTVDEAEKMLRASRRTTYFCLSACDTKGGCVFEVTPKTVERRGPEKDVCCCTNHFRTEALCVGKKCGRFDTLEKLHADGKKLGVAEVYRDLDAVSQGVATMQTMVFEPADRVVHVAYGGGKSATKKPLVKIDLKPLFSDKKD